MFRCSGLRDPRRLASAKKRAHQYQKTLTQATIKPHEALEAHRSRSRSRILSIRKLHKKPRYRSPERVLPPRPQ
ncbi:hypothetical protein TSAR_008755 [Trichomalopsis sarcophagae]|uniref:Uncharacterized protein n=1 Tax=Trichomalopsis sarcophagae TaxID=543379 RepID=A0A232FIV3_9HYME|nr:hypothetical protein TSAR_008755 [Trichomalopsis sarcophagae]